MKDRYLFKAKRVDNGEWMIGNLIQTDDGIYIIQNYVPQYLIKNYEVDPSTICQCTGLKDKNGKLIWENDIVFVTDDDGCSGQIDTGVGEIDFLDGLWYISGNVQNALYDIDKCFQLEVIGNIFDNPDLLEMEV